MKEDIKRVAEERGKGAGDDDEEEEEEESDDRLAVSSMIDMNYQDEKGKTLLMKVREKNNRYRPETKKITQS